MKSIDDLDIRLLKLFLVIVDSGGFSAAQYQLNMHQSSISKKMSDLETRLGMTLCQRGRGGFNLTNDGLKVYEASKKLFEHMNDFQDEINDIRNVSSGNIHIGLTDNLATNKNCHIQAAISNFCGKYSKVNINTHIFDTSLIEKKLLENKFDVGITSPEVFKSGLKYTYIFNEQQHLYCTPSHSILGLGRTVTAEDVVAHPVVDRGLAHPVTPLNHVKELSYKSKTTNMEATAHMILSGYFIGYLPEHYAQIWIDRQQLVKIPTTTELEYKPDFYLTFNDKQDQSCAAKALVSAIIDAHNLKTDC
ncbi:LysR family transcriptional regulator [Photobacterium chitinilyticum]|uniref:LysR family transcriptional regulator n=1 Tax=Photobacterium chitinilyticum TaxID=2485123 RepID=A0A3S3RET8_9GAMM|nr:LysR family transcriptional regulator [Photobacterium chitinilyticum]RWX53445.1 LysR family transcriptional regulator [Photobacterium chitinilyticum]